MNKYSLVIEQKIEGSKDFHTTVLINIEGNSIPELLGKLPLQIHNYVEMINSKVKQQLIDDDIPF